MDTDDTVSVNSPELLVDSMNSVHFAEFEAMDTSDDSVGDDSGIGTTDSDTVEHFPFYIEDIAVFIMWMTWTCLSLTGIAMKSKAFDVVFPTENHISELLQIAPTLEFAAGLVDVFQAATPPTIDFFKTLPLHLNKKWAVYLLVLEKPGHLPRVYIGSGTTFTVGVLRRMSTYDRRSQLHQYIDTVSEYVNSSMDKGFTITHKGLLVWADIPLASEKYRFRSLFLLLETVFSLCFWTMKSRTKHYFMPGLCPWSRESFTYDGLCTHFSIMEIPKGILQYFTPEQREAYNAQDAERHTALQTKYTLAKGPGVHAAWAKRSRDRALEAQTYKCTLCDLTFPNEAKRIRHLDGSAHKKKVAGIGRQTNGRGGGQTAIRNKTFWCELCQHAASSQKRLERHLNARPHAKKIRDREASAKLAASVTPTTSQTKKPEEQQERAKPNTLQQWLVVGGVVRDLLDLLKEANQEVPAFLENIAREGSGFGGGGGGRGGGRSGGRGRGGGANRDFRKTAGGFGAGGGGGGYGGSGGGYGGGGGGFNGPPAAAYGGGAGGGYGGSSGGAYGQPYGNQDKNMGPQSSWW
ncbi:C2H2 and C2HC zinc finger [Glarea lozoyensis ATCC 20868]|uniref:C2H2 and C2HC zinc finger n=1 Tax=Glarea lozoyensis (strain ATCC 20868 / MF5171) TaxID=1116229 RepID=S3DLI2_GLAL2|nr:C2H2 and C2HC zinc finger [Glarea lozoyensis ATCC 20868]EPE32906.1 C2H2 and C2HC zinc finger [Glarea lozoyensis ATCC 20868]